MLQISYTWWSKPAALEVREVEEEGKEGVEEVEYHTKATKQLGRMAGDLARRSVTDFLLCANGQPCVCVCVCVCSCERGYTGE